MSRLAPYDLIATEWSRARKSSSFREKLYVDGFLNLVPAGGHILDLGCGMGEPIGRYLMTQGYLVTGVDSSPEMLQLARKNFPGAEFFEGNIESLELPAKYDGIIAWDSIFHIPKSKHASVFRSLYRRLKPNAPLLVSLGGSEDEFTDTMFGVEFFYSGHAPAVSAALLEEAGFEIILSEVDDPGSRGHLAILSRKRE